jgi:hypothetical protein
VPAVLHDRAHVLRWGEKRRTAVLLPSLGKVASRAINGQSPVLPTIGAGFTLVGLKVLYGRTEW